jgi:hypothetical protein
VNDQGSSDANASIQTPQTRQQYSAPTLVTFGAIRDLTAGGSGSASEFNAPGRGFHQTRRG